MILQSVPTCWISVCVCLKGQWSKKVPLPFMQQSREKFKTTYPETINGNYLNIWKPLQEITLDIRKANITISSIIPIVSMLKLPLSCDDHHSMEIQTMKKAILSNTEKAFGNNKVSSTLGIACLFNPGYKNYPPLQSCEASQMKIKICVHLITIYRNLYMNANEQT